MQINITARHDAKASSAIKERIMAKLRKNSNHFDHITNIQVTIDKDGNNDLAEATLHLDTGSEIFAKAQSNNMYSAIDALSAKIESQLQKVKSKIKTRKGAHHSKRSVFLDDSEMASV